MPINFPNSPILNEQYTYDNKTWEWNGTYWEVYSALTSYITSAYTVGDGISDISGVTGGNITLKSFSGVNITIVDGGDKLTFSGSPQQNVVGFYLPLSGGTVTGNTIFTSGLTASTLTSNGSITASTSIARGNYLQPTLVAAANNDVLVGLDIAPTFTTGAFSGVIGYGLYVRSNIATTPNTSIRLGIGSTGSTSEFVSFGGGRNYIGFDRSLGGAVIGSVSTRSISFGLGNEGSTTVYGRFHATTGNFTLQNGGTFTDAGYRLDVVGSDARINGVRVGLGGGNLTTNTAVGDNALNANTTGTNNTSLGFYSLQSNTTGIGNTSLGFASLYSLSGGGGNNVSIGRESARYIADGTTTLNNSSTSIFIGTYTKALANSQSNQIVIGYDAIGLGSNSVVLGNSGITKTALQGNILIGTTTDDGYKLDVSGTTMLRGIVYGVGSGGVPIQLLTTVGTGTAVVGGNTATPIRVQAQNIQLYVGSTAVGYFHPTTGNFTLQNGGTFTDAGFRLDVQGQARVTGNSFLAATFINVISAQTSAILQADSTSRGFLPPRMTSTQRDAISSPATGLTVYQTTDNYLSLYNGVNWQNIVSPNSNGNVLIGKTTDSGQKLQVSGDTLISGGLTANTISATVKMFDIEHPTKDGLRLRHGNLEGPENGVYFRGTIVNQKEIILPDYWEGLVDESSITVSLTPIGFFQSLFVVSKSNKKIIIDNNEDKNHFDFVIYGERKDINKLIIEYKK